MFMDLYFDFLLKIMNEVPIHVMKKLNLCVGSICAFSRSLIDSLKDYVWITLIVYGVFSIEENNYGL